MKVTLKNARILFVLALINIPLCGLLYYLQLEGIGVTFADILLLECFVFFILLLYFFIRALLLLQEATAVIAAYTMFAVILAINGITIIFPRLLNGAYVGWLGTLTLVIGLLVAFRSFFVRAKFLKLPFMLFGAGMALLTLPRLFILLVSTDKNMEIVSLAGDAGLILLLFANCFILKRIVDFLKANNGQLVPIDAGSELEDTGETEI